MMQCSQTSSNRWRQVEEVGGEGREYDKITAYQGTVSSHVLYVMVFFFSLTAVGRSLCVCHWRRSRAETQTSDKVCVYS